MPGSRSAPSPTRSSSASSGAAGPGPAAPTGSAAVRRVVGPGTGGLSASARPRRRRRRLRHRRPPRTWPGTPPAVEPVLLGADRLDHVGRQQAADLGGALEVDPPRQAGQEPGPKGVTDARRVGHPVLAGTSTAIGGCPRRSTRAPFLPSVVTRIATWSSRSSGRPPGALLDQCRLVLVAEQHGRPGDEGRGVLAGEAAELLRGVGGEGQAALPALLGVVEHRRRVVGADDHQADCRRPAPAPGPARCRAPMPSRPGRTRRSGSGRRRSCRRTARCGGCR